MATLRPLLDDPAAGHEPHSPVRDDSKLAASEDLDRQPDGVPHAVVGLTALFAVILAMLVAFMFVTGQVGRIAAVVLAAAAIPTLVAALQRKADRERDRAHPSR